MKAIDFKGIIPPIQTSFTKEGEVYEKGMRELIRFTLPYVHAYYPLGTYGCGPFMTVDERKKTLEMILDEVNGKVPVIAHVGAPGTKVAVDLAKHAKAAGAAAVGAISPFYSPKLKDEYLFGYFADIQQAVGDDEFPVFVYNNGSYSQNPVSPAMLRRLAREAGIRGCKDSSFDIFNYYLYKDAVKDIPNFNVIIGTEAIFVPAFDYGAQACVCGIGNIYPDLMRKMYDTYMAGDLTGAYQCQDTIRQVRNLIKINPTIPTMHAILELRGIACGYPAAPFYKLDDSVKESLKKALKEIGLL